MTKLALAVILCAATTAALAQSKDEQREAQREVPQPATAAAGGSQSAQDLFRRLDRNGRISPAEFAVLR